MMEKSNKAIEGKNGFLFLGGPDSNMLVPHLTGEMRISRAACAVHNHNAGTLSQLRQPHMVLIVPEAHVVRHDLLPDGINVVGNRPVATALRILGDAAVYPQQMLMQMQATDITVYTGKDSHWTTVAAYETYRRLRIRLGRRTDLTDVYEPSYLIEAEDLCALSPEETIRKEKAIRSLKPHGYQLCFATGILNSGGITISLNEKGEGRCLAFGTSFSSRLVPAYASDFREVVFCYGTAIDEAVLKMVRPDVVIIEMPERFVHFPTMAVEGGVLAGAHLASREPGFDSLQIFRPERLSPDLLRFANVVAALCDRSASAADLMRAVAAIDAHSPAAARRTATALEMASAVSEHRALRALLGGGFRRPDVLGALFSMVDSNAFRVADADALPQSEMGLLAATRLMIRKGLYSQAKHLIIAADTRFGPSPESSQYRQHLGC